MSGKRLSFIIIILTILLLNVNQITYLHEDDISEDYEFTRSKAEIRVKWHEYRPVYDSDPYEEEANPLFPYKCGKLRHEFIEDGVNMANFVRYLAEIPDDLESDDVLNKHAQYGAVLLAATNELTHKPQKPYDMTINFYQTASKAIKKSNIASNIYTLSDAVIGYMMDFGDSNLEDVGHRRWILNPQMKKIGFGYCHGYSSMKVLNTDRVKEYDYDYITYPSEGYFPSDIFFASRCPYGSNPWSIVLNPKKYDNERTSDIRVELKHLNDDLIYWFFCPKDEDITCEKYFRVDTSNCGVPFCIIFRPDNIYDYEDGDLYKVTITGLYTIEGKETKIEYIVNFFDL